MNPGIEFRILEFPLFSHFVSRYVFTLSNPIPYGSWLYAKIFCSILNAYPFIIDCIRHLFTSNCIEISL